MIIIVCVFAWRTLIQNADAEILLPFAHESAIGKQAKTSNQKHYKKPV